jgi:hypothetical protein
MNRTQEMDTAVGLVLTGLARLRAAVDTDDVVSHAYVLRLVHDQANRDAGLLHAMQQLLDTVWSRLTEGSDIDADQAADWLGLAANSIEDKVGEYIDRTREALGPFDFDGVQATLTKESREA